MIFNFVIAFFLIFVGHEARKIEVVKMELINKIKLKEQEININEIEYALHNDNRYLKKLFSIYQDNPEKKALSKIIKLSEYPNYSSTDYYKVKFE